MSDPSVDLQGIRVLVTRPSPAGEILCERINALKGKATQFATINIIPRPEDELVRQLADIAIFDWLIFVSPQAVNIAKPFLHPESPYAIAAVGRGCADALKQIGFDHILFPTVTMGGVDLLKLLPDVADKKIAIIKGEGGRDELNKGLISRGASVTEKVIYQRTIPVNPEFLSLDNFDVVVTTSSEGLRNFALIFAKQPEKIFSLTVLVISPAMVITAKALGFKHILLAPNPTHDGIIQTLFSNNRIAQGKVMSDELPISDQELPTKAGAATKFRFIYIMVACLIIAALTAGMYIGFCHLKKANEQLAENIAQSSLIVKKSLAEQQAKLQATDNTLREMKEAFATQQENLNNLADKNKIDKNIWDVYEADYLTKLANNNLLSGSKTALVINQLQAADKALQPLTDPKLQPIRKALAADIAALQSVAPVDIEGIYLKLLALNNQVDKMALPNRHTSQAPIVDNDSSADKVWWKRGLEQTWQRLRQLVVVRYDAPGSKPFIAPGEQDFIYQNFHSLFMQAMWASVHKQGRIYQSSLEQLIAWTQKYFVLDNTQTNEWLKTLSDLSHVNIQPQLPAITDSLAAFHTYFMERSQDAAATNVSAQQ